MKVGGSKVDNRSSTYPEAAVPDPSSFFLHLTSNHIEKPLLCFS